MCSMHKNTHKPSKATAQHITDTISNHQLRRLVALGHTKLNSLIIRLLFSLAVYKCICIYRMCMPGIIRSSCMFGNWPNVPPPTNQTLFVHSSRLSENVPLAASRVQLLKLYSTAISKYAANFDVSIRIVEFATLQHPHQNGMFACSMFVTQKIPNSIRVEAARGEALQLLLKSGPRGEQLIFQTLSDLDFEDFAQSSRHFHRL